MMSNRNINQNDLNLITFKAISNFTNDLADVFADKHRPLKLYAHLINKTTIVHNKPIQKHINSFKLFCIDNREAIMSKNHGSFTVNTISYSEKVYIDMEKIFELADKDTKNVIWNHILTISALVDPTAKAKEILKKNQTENSDSNEANFLTDIISKIEQNVDHTSTSNPMEAVGSIMNSGIFNDLVNGMGTGLDNGTLDLSKLMSTVQNMVTQLDVASNSASSSNNNNNNNNVNNNNNGNDDDHNNSCNNVENNDTNQQALDLMKNMIGELNTKMDDDSTDNTDNTIPDISNILGPLMNAMLNNQNMVMDNN